ncbi:hypothetical protein [Cysteiniphilum marinum]|nr:hypothetical protein [Cysteiniphilum marinum]
MITGLLSYVLVTSGAISAFTSFIGKYIISFKKICIYSLLIQCIACVILGTNNFDFIEIGLGIYSIGYGLIATCTTIFIDYYLDDIKAEEKQKDQAFTNEVYFFNFGLLIGSLIGFFVIDFGVLFIVGFVFNAIAFLFYIVGYDFIKIPSNFNKHFVSSNAKVRHLIFMIVLSMSIIAAVMIFKFKSALIINLLIILAGILLLSYLIFTFKKAKQTAKHSLKLFLLYLVFLSIIFISYQFLPLLCSSIGTFNSDGTILGYNFGFDSSSVGILNSIILVITAYILAKYYETKTISYRKAFMISYFIMFLAFMILFIGTIYTDNAKIALPVVITFIIIVSFGEILLQPISFTMVNQMIAPDHRPVFYSGIGFLVRTLSPLTCNAIIAIALSQQRHQQVEYFSIIFLAITAILGISLLVLKFLVKE